MWNIFLTVFSIKNIIVIRFSEFKNSECDEHNSDSNQIILMRKNSFTITNFIADNLIHKFSHFNIFWQKILNNSFQNNNQVHNKNDFNNNSISLLNISFKTCMMIKLSIKLFFKEKFFLKCELNFLSKKLNQKLNEYFMSDALQANKIFVEMSQKFWLNWAWWIRFWIWNHVSQNQWCSEFLNLTIIIFENHNDFFIKKLKNTMNHEIFYKKLIHCHLFFCILNFIFLFLFHLN